MGGSDMPRRSPRLQGSGTERQPEAKATILGIPTEIRLYIYEYLYLMLKPVVTHSCACHNAEAADCALTASRGSNEFHGYAAVLLTCRTFYHEAADLLYRPITHPKSTENLRPRLTLSADDIKLSNFPTLFCRNHLEYRCGTAGIFRRVKDLCIMITVGLTIAACDSPSSIEFGDVYDEEEERMSRPVDAYGMSQTMDNVRWLAHQMKHSAGFRFLSISAEWECYQEADLGDVEVLLKPFKALRNVKELKFPELGTLFEFWVDAGGMDGIMMEQWERVIAYKKKMREILQSNAPVAKNPIPLGAWLDFKRTAKRLIMFSPHGQMQGHLSVARQAVEEQDKTLFWKALTGLRKAWKDEKQQRQKMESQVSNLLRVELLDIPQGKRKEDDPEGMEFSVFNWADPDIDKDDRFTYITYLEGIDD